MGEAGGAGVSVGAAVGVGVGVGVASSPPQAASAAAISSPIDKKIQREFRILCPFYFIFNLDGLNNITTFDSVDHIYALDHLAKERRYTCGDHASRPIPDPPSNFHRPYRPASTTAPPTT